MFWNLLKLLFYVMTEPQKPITPQYVLGNVRARQVEREALEDKRQVTLQHIQFVVDSHLVASSHIETNIPFEAFFDYFKPILGDPSYRDLRRQFQLGNCDIGTVIHGIVQWIYNPLGWNVNRVRTESLVLSFNPGDFES